MANTDVPIDVLQRTIDTWELNGQNQSKAARALGLDRTTFRHRLEHAKVLGLSPNGKVTFKVDELPSFNRTAREIIDSRRGEFGRRKAAKEARRLISVQINSNDPIGILTHGDPHLDDPGTDIALIEQQIELIHKTDGLFGACIGDFINNWRGTLARLHGAQTTTQMDALILLEWYIQAIKWLFLIGGNHDVWHGEGDPLLWFRGGIGAIYEWHGTRIALKFPNRKECRIHARHNFPGNSIYNPAHGATRAARFSGEDHIYISGHIHDWGYMVQENPIKDLIWHAVQLAAFKKIDDYADTLGRESKRYGESVVIVIDPQAKTPSEFVTVFWDVQKGADFLTWLRQQRRG